jgi:hypothetical protein
VAVASASASKQKLGAAEDGGLLSGGEQAKGARPAGSVGMAGLIELRSAARAAVGHRDSALSF